MFKYFWAKNIEKLLIEKHLYQVDNYYHVYLFNLLTASIAHDAESFFVKCFYIRAKLPICFRMRTLRRICVRLPVAPSKHLFPRCWPIRYRSPRVIKMPRVRAVDMESRFWTAALTHRRKSVVGIMHPRPEPSRRSSNSKGLAWTAAEWDPG